MLSEHPLCNGENERMRTHLKVSFAEKDKVKALGARWDPALKVWYVENVPDLARFAAWIPELAGYQQPHGGQKSVSAAANIPSKQPTSAASMVSGPAVVQPDCNCDVLPWAHCEHTLQP